MHDHRQGVHGNVHLSNAPTYAHAPTDADADADTDADTDADYIDVYLPVNADGDTEIIAEPDEYGEYIELCFTGEMAGVIPDEDQHVGDGEIVTMRVYLSSAANKRAVVVKEDDLLTKNEMQAHAVEVSRATMTELKTWLQNHCFETCDLRYARSVMTSRYVCKWK